MQHSALAQRDRDALLGVYSRYDLEIAHGDGVFLHDTKGRAVLDLFAGLAVNALGYRHPAVVDAQIAQLRKFAHVSNYFAQEPQIALAEHLKRLTGFEKVFFCNSGTEAMEAALKLARRWGARNERGELVAFRGGFHGRTFGPLSLMSQAKYRDGFGPFLPGSRTLPFNDCAELEKNVSRTTTAVFLECIQGEGGIIPITEEFAETMLRLREKHGFLIVADEIQAGLGRTGTFMSYEHWDLKPDIALIAKALGGGLPLGAMLVSRDLEEVLGKGSHGTTFGGNPVACAGGRAALDVIVADNLMENNRRHGAYFLNGLRQLQNKYPSLIQECRGMGLMLGMELFDDAGIVFERMLEHGVLVNVTQDRIIRILPSYLIRTPHIDHAISVFDAVFSTLSSNRT